MVTPPKDHQEKSRRYIVLQRAFASVGVEYTYHIKSVSCESFALMMIGLFKESQAIQAEVLRSHKKDPPDDELRAIAVQNTKRYKYFYESVLENIKRVKYGVRLTLKFMLNCPSNPNPKDELITTINDLYNQLMNSIISEDTKSIKELIDIGLDLHSTTRYGKTALTLAASRGLTNICKILIDANDENCTIALNHKDANHREPLEYAGYYNHADTYEFLKQQIAKSFTVLDNTSLDIRR